MILLHYIVSDISGGVLTVIGSDAEIKVSLILEIVDLYTEAPDI